MTDLDKATLQLAAAAQIKGHRLYKLGQSAGNDWQLGDVPQHTLDQIDQTINDIVRAWYNYHRARGREKENA